MTNPLSDLLRVIEGATPQWESAELYVSKGYLKLSETDYAAHDKYHRTFNPVLVRALVEECMAARHFMDNLWAVNQDSQKAYGGEWDTANERAHDTARAATDKILGVKDD